MKISFITTVYNEELTIKRFLDSLFVQTRLPDEVVIVDGDSTDNTVERIKKQKLKISEKKIAIKIIVKPGNRSVGRNEAIRNSSGDIIVCSDSGNILDKRWIEYIVKPFKDPTVDVVAGYYKGNGKNVFQKSITPYALVMEDKVNPQNFLPATRSVAFRKSTWKKVGGFEETLSHNEDYVFARRLKEIGAKIIFAKNALVYWIPRNTYKEAFVMMFRFAYGDIEAGIVRPKVILLFLRYVLALGAFIFFWFTHNFFIIALLFLCFIFYIIWAIAKNYKYVKDPDAVIILPLLQFTADAAVCSGSLLALFRINIMPRYSKKTDE